MMTLLAAVEGNSKDSKLLRWLSSRIGRAGCLGLHVGRCMPQLDAHWKDCSLAGCPTRDGLQGAAEHGSGTLRPRAHLSG